MEKKKVLLARYNYEIISERLKRITTQPMEGFGDKTIFFSKFGSNTTQDGQLILNNRTFDEAFENNPQDLTALFTDRLHSTSSLVVPKLSGAQTKTYKLENIILIWNSG